MKIKIQVKPKSSINKVEKINDNEYIVRVKALPIDGKANIEIIKYFKKEYKVDVNIIGKTSKKKIIAKI